MTIAPKIGLSLCLLAGACSKPVRRITATTAVPPVVTGASSQDAATASANSDGTAAGPGSVAVTLVSRSGSKAAGMINILANGDSLSFVGLIHGLTPSAKHALHIAAVGNCEASDASSAGNDFSPTSGDQHLSGALAALSTDASGVAAMTMQVNGFSLSNASPSGLLGKSLIVYEQPDDAAGKTNTSARWACGVIDEKSAPTADKPTSYSATLTSGTGQQIGGHIVLRQADNGMAFTGDLNGLVANTRYHIQLQTNASGVDCTGNFSAVGAVLSPFLVPADDGATAPTPLGDLGTVTADGSGKASISITRQGATLSGSAGVLGRAFVVAADASAVSNLLACGIIR